jgi:hypothetical protein
MKIPSKAQFGFISAIVFAGVLFLPSISFAANITSVTAFAWGDTLGWVNFSPTNGNVTVTDTAVMGYAWSANYGWINLAPTNGGVVNDGNGNLSGKGWGSATGWIDFTGVSIDSNGEFRGETAPSIVGIINFSCANCLVVTSWKPGSQTTSSSTTTNTSTGNGSSSGGSGSLGYSTILQQPLTQIIYPATDSQHVQLLSSEVQGIQGNSSIYGTALTVSGSNTYSTSTNSKLPIPQEQIVSPKTFSATKEILGGLGILLLIGLILWKLLH